MTLARKVGAALSSALETGPSRSTQALQRAQVLAALEAPEGPRRWRLALLAGCAVLVLGVGVPLLRAPALGPELRGVFRGQTMAESARVVAPATPGEVLDFSDGSQLRLGAQAELSLSKLAPNRANLVLARGRIEARIRKGTGRTWTLAAGPYSVRVVGTEFSVDWDEPRGLFAVKVSEGKVLVTGGGLEASGVMLGAGQHLERYQQAAPSPAEPASSAVAVASPAPPDGEPARARAAPVPNDPSFQSLAARGEYSAAMGAARRAGFDRLTRELSAQDLLLLANSARYAGTLAEARSALLQLRERFAGTPNATHAALLLAGQAEDRAKNSVEAERWLRTFLTESPNGELAAMARARLLASLLKSGRRGEAEQTARDYLRLHPNGAYAAKARELLASP